MIKHIILKKDNSSPGFRADHPGTIRFFNRQRQNKLIQDISAGFVVEVRFFLQFAGQPVEGKNNAYPRIREIIFNGPDCGNKIAVAADQDNLFISGCQPVGGQGHIHISLFLFMPCKRFAAIFAYERFFLEAALNYIDAIKFTGFNKNLVATHCVFTPFRKGGAIIEGTDEVAFPQEMMAIAGIVKPAELAWKILYGMIEIEAINYEGCGHGRSPIKKNPDACAGGASARWHISPTAEGMMALLLPLSLYCCQYIFDWQKYNLFLERV